MQTISDMMGSTTERMPPDQLAAENWRMYERARDSTGFSEWITHARRCDRYYLGKQWSEEDLAVLRRSRRPALTINQILSTVNIILGEHANQRMDLRFKPRNANPGDGELADVVTKVHQHVLDINEYESIEADVFADGIIQDRGYFDIRVQFDDHMRGEVVISQLDNQTVVPDPQAKKYDPSTWNEVTITKWLSMDDVELTYGREKADKVRSYASGDHFGYDSIRFDRSSTFGEGESDQAPMDAWIAGVNEANERSVKSVRVIERQHKKMGQSWYYVDQQSGDMSRVPEDWDDARREKFAQDFGLAIIPKLEKKIRWTVSCDGVLLHDGWSPYQSFTVVPFFPFFRSGQPLGVVSNLLDPQDQLNKLASQELHVVNTTANSGWIIDTGALQNMTVDELRERGAETGLVIEKVPDRTVEKITPNQIPTGLDRIVSRSQVNLQEISGVNQAMRGEASPEMSGVALESNQARAMTQMQVPLNNLQRTRKILARKILELVQQYYTEERVVTITDPLRPEGPDAQESVAINEVTPEGRIVNDITYGKYDAVVSTVPSRDTFNDTQFAEAVQLRSAGIAIPDDRVIELSNLSGKYDLAKEIREMQGRGELSEEEVQMAEMQQTAQMRLMLGEVARIEEEVAEIAARRRKLEAEATELEGGLDSPEYRMKRFELEQEERIKERELQTRLRLAELSNMNNLDTGVIGARGQQLLERERRQTALLQQRTASTSNQQK